MEEKSGKKGGGGSSRRMWSLLLTHWLTPQRIGARISRKGLLPGRKLYDAKRYINKVGFIAAFSMCTDDHFGCQLRSETGLQR